jgi:hypothetical protein
MYCLAPVANTAPCILTILLSHPGATNKFFEIIKAETTKEYA